MKLVPIILLLTLICVLRADKAKVGSEAGSSGGKKIDAEAVVAGYDKRVEAMFRAESGKPLVRKKILPPMGGNRGNFSRHYSWSLTAYAARCFYLNEDLEKANAALRENAQHYIDNPKEVFMHIRAGGKEQLCHFVNNKLPAVTEGRIGLRHMFTRSARYKDFKVSTLPVSDGPRCGGRESDSPAVVMVREPVGVIHASCRRRQRTEGL